MSKPHAHTSNEDISESLEDASCNIPNFSNRDDTSESLGDASSSTPPLNNNNASIGSFDMEIDCKKNRRNSHKTCL